MRFRTLILSVVLPATLVLLISHSPGAMRRLQQIHPLGNPDPALANR
jgi:hypothetical protein